jgi:hypothetical protein
MIYGINRLGDKKRKNFVTGGEEESLPGQSKLSYHLSHESGIPLAEIARHLGVCTSVIVKAIQKLES